jgi:hypothetical protein
MACFPLEPRRVGDVAQQRYLTGWDLRGRVINSGLGRVGYKLAGFSSFNALYIRQSGPLPTSRF